MDDQPGPSSRMHLPDRQRPTFNPKPPDPVNNTQAVLKSHMSRTQPGISHEEIRKKMYFPGWDYESPLFQQPISKPRERQVPVRSLTLPPLQSADSKHTTALVLQKASSLTRPGSSTKSKEPTPKQHRNQLSFQPPVQLPPLQSQSKDKSNQKVSTPDLSFGKKAPICEPKSSVYRIKDAYFMISHLGVTCVSKNKMDLSPECQQECSEEEVYQRLICIPYFAHFNMFKYFYTWRKIICVKKILLAKTYLTYNLFFVNRCLGPALLDIWKRCIQIGDTSLFCTKQNHTYSLQEFQEFQSKRLQKVRTDLEKFQGLVKELTFCSCRHYSTHPKPVGFRDIEKFAILRASHQKRFIRLIDLLVSNTFHTLVVKGVDKVLSVFREKVDRTPSPTQIQNWSSQPEVSSEPAAEEDKSERDQDVKDDQGQPIFLTKLKISVNNLTYTPSEEHFQEAVAELIKQCKEILSFNTLSSDPDFDKFTSTPSPKSKDSKKKHEEEPCFEAILDNDTHLQKAISNINEAIHFAFDAAKVYSDTFERSRLFYKENKCLDVDSLWQQEHGLSFFEKALGSYHSQYKEALMIPQWKNLGLVLVDNSVIKEELVNSPLLCLEVINEMLPQVAKRRVDAINAETDVAQVQLESSPSTTVELANYLIFLDQIQERIKVLAEEEETCGQLYNLVNTYSIPTPPEDLCVFALLKNSISELEWNIYGAVWVEKDTMNKFCASLKKDIKDFNQEIMKVDLKSQDRRLLDIDADPAEVSLLLGEIHISVDKLRAQAATYLSYQKQLKVEVRFDSLDRLTEEVRLKQLLWDSLEEWKTLWDGWMASSLMELDLEQLGEEVNKYAEYVDQLEKGLPSNNFVPSFKEKVEVMKSRIPVITDLRSPYMKLDQWEILEYIVGKPLNAEKITVAELDELNLFSYGPEIQQISGQASEELSGEISGVTRHNSDEMREDSR